MSRAPPFPTVAARRPREPPPPDGFTSPPATAPLSINRERSVSRPVTPSSRQPIPPPLNSSPARPSRSGLRQRQPSTSSASVSGFRDAPRSSNEDTFGSVRPRRPSAGQTGQRSANGETEISPTQQQAVTAFRQAARRKASRDDVFEDDRRREREEEEMRQRKMRERNAARRPANGRTLGGEIEAILDEIKDEWESVLEPDFNPVDLALFLLDDNSRGREMESFERMRKRLGKALKGTIDKNYQAFAAALPHHNSLLNHLGTTQTQVTTLRQSLMDVKEAVSNKRADLVQLWQRGQQLEEMTKILNQIEYLKAIPDKLESLMSEKRLVPASALLVSSLKVIGKPDMIEIGALSDIRSYLFSQETSLREILIEELHSHLYLKTFWCDSRWTPYLPGQTEFPPVPYDEEGAPPNDNKEDSRAYHSRLFRYLHQLALRPNEPPYDTTLTDYDPRRTSMNLDLPPAPGGAQATVEGDSFTYMETILESLAVLGKLGAALEAVTQRLPTEISNLVESTITEVSERVEASNRMSILGPMDSNRASGGVFMSIGGNSGGLRLAALELSVKENSREVLRDLFWTLYSKLDAVVQGLRVISEVSNRIGSRRTFKDSSSVTAGSLFPLTEQWLPVQAEVRGLLQDYLIDEQSGAAANRNPISSINEILRLSMIKSGAALRNTDQTKVFRLADSDMKQTVKSLKQHEEELALALKESVPGLAKESTESTVQAAFSIIGADDRLSAGGHHALLLAPDAFHVGVLFQPTLAFLDRMVEILPAGVESARPVSVYLEEFVITSYLPQLQEKVHNLFHLAISGPEAFREDVTLRTVYKQPLAKATVQISALVNTLTAMLQTTPFHKEDYSRLVLGVVIQFYQQCSDQSRDLVARDAMGAGQPAIIKAAQWAQSTEVAKTLTAMLKSTDEKELVTLNEEETKAEMEILGEGSISEEDIIPSARDLRSLCTLYSSLTWFIQQLTLLRPPSDDPDTPMGLPEPPTTATPFTPSLPIVTILKPNDPLKLPLTRDMMARFVSLLKAFKQLADDILFTIRLDIRCRVIRLLTQMIRKSTYSLDKEATEPDPYVIELNNDLSMVDDATSNALGEKERTFVFAGLGMLISHMLVSSSVKIKSANEAGIKKMQRNILALQQNLKTIQQGPKEADLDRAKKYWGLFFQTPQQLMAGIRQKMIFTQGEYEAMAKFICESDPENVPANGGDTKYEIFISEFRHMLR